MELDTLILSRLQFAANISFHIIFPTITIALGWILLFFKLRYQATGDEKWMDAYLFYVKVFALSFAMGVVSGITMSFQRAAVAAHFSDVPGGVRHDDECVLDFGAEFMDAHAGRIRTSRWCCACDRLVRHRF